MSRRPTDKSIAQSSWPGGTVYVNTVETFEASASNYWSRVASALGRLTQYVASRSATTWHLLVADDYHPEAGGLEYRTSLVAFFVLASHSRSFGVGENCRRRLSEVYRVRGRADLFVRWCLEVADKDTVCMTEFEEGPRASAWPGPWSTSDRSWRHSSGSCPCTREAPSVRSRRTSSSSSGAWRFMCKALDIALVQRGFLPAA